MRDRANQDGGVRKTNAPRVRTRPGRVDQDRLSCRWRRAWKPWHEWRWWSWVQFGGWLGFRARDCGWCAMERYHWMLSSIFGMHRTSNSSRRTVINPTRSYSEASSCRQRGKGRKRQCSHLWERLVDGKTIATQLLPTLWGGSDDFDNSCGTSRPRCDPFNFEFISSWNPYCGMSTVRSCEYMGASWRRHSHDQQLWRRCWAKTPFISFVHTVNSLPAVCSFHCVLTVYCVYYTTYCVQYVACN